MRSIYKISIDPPFRHATSTSTLVGYVVGKGKAERLVVLTKQKIKAIERWQEKYRESSEGEPAVYYHYIGDLVDFEEDN